MLTYSQIFTQIKYPETKKASQEDDYFGTKVTDPYRWLENDNSEETNEWVTAENKITHEYLSSITFNGKLKKRLEEMWNYAKYCSPFTGGDFYCYKNDELQNQSVLSGNED